MRGFKTVFSFSNYLMRQYLFNVSNSLLLDL